MSVLYRDVLKLNKNWQVLGVVSVRKAMEDLASGQVTALNFVDGYPMPCKWEEWIKIPVADNEEHILCSHNRKIKLVRVIISVRFDKLIVKPPKLTLKNLRIRDKDTCIYTGKKLKPSEMSIEHIIPQSLNGKDTWDNVALAHRDVNSKRGNLPLEKVGLKLRWVPHAPRAKKPAELIENKHNYPEWELFLYK